MDRSSNDGLTSSKRKSSAEEAAQKKSRIDSAEGAREDHSNVEEAHLLPFGSQIDFMSKNDLTNATLIVEGKKIYAGADYLSLHSPYFASLLKGDKFAEKSSEEKEIKDVSYNDFIKMLKFLHNPSQSIEAENVETLLTLGDRFFIMSVVDRVEDFLIGTSRFAVSAKLLVADRYRLIRLQTLCYDSIGNNNEQNLDEVKSSEEFSQLSDAAKSSFNAVVEKSKFPTNGKLKLHRGLGDGVEDMNEVENVAEPENGFVATGVIAMQYESKGANTHTIHLSGLIWSIYDDSEKFDDGELLIAPSLILNRDRPTSSDWEVEGYIEVAVWTAAIADKITDEQTVHKKFTFSMDNSARIQEMPEFFVSCLEHTHTIVYYTIKITKISGVRNIPRSDLGNFSDVVLIVEGHKIQVNKQYLSTISSIFHELLYDKKEVELKETKYQDFVEFLQWIYPSSRRNLSVSSLFSVLRVAQQFEVNMNTTVISEYLLRSHKDALLPEKIIFHFEFGCGQESDLGHPFEGVGKDIKLFHVAKSRLRKSPVFSEMSAVKKVALYEWMIDRGFDMFECGFPAVRSPVGSDYS